MVRARVVTSPAHVTSSLAGDPCKKQDAFARLRTSPSKPDLSLIHQNDATGIMAASSYEFPVCLLVVSGLDGIRSWAQVQAPRESSGADFERQ